MLSSERQEYLDAFLRPHDCTADDLVRQVDDSFGAPKAIVAAGSVLQGFGNSSSDLDLHVVVDDGRVTDFPVGSYDLGIAVDVNYVGQSWITEAAVSLAGVFQPPCDRAEWKARYRRLNQVGRFALGQVLTGEPAWRDWCASLADGYPRAALDWWRAETIRYRTAAQLLQATNPPLAAQRFCEAGIACLNGIAAAGGEPYVGQKWTGPKLARIGRPDLVEVFSDLLAVPYEPGQVSDYLKRTRAIVDDLSAGWSLPVDPVVVLSPAAGVQTWKVRDRHLVHRWGLRGIEVSTAEPAMWISEQLNWRGPVSELPPLAERLVADGLVWLAIEEAA
ncbi:hypothetical protein [Fodinicola acaciae]|uniref:hypothetical protein n=1 Tax=Fodinicola acaciae TaxID=2681555 RepID=UPI0013D4A82C|nr:hypothetical protein [Fodinicola acaciae]